MNSFTIRDIENLCGIKAHTLRIWETRYKLGIPKRNEGNRRLYDNDDLKHLLRIAFLYHNGHKISSIARLDESEICQLAMAQYSAGKSSEIFINHLTEASLDLEQDRFDRVLHNIILHMGFEKAITQVAFPFLKKIGLLWLTGNVVAAQEHFASALILKKIYVAINGLDTPMPSFGKTVLIFAPEGEFHEIPLLYMRYLMKKHGVSVIYFGKNTPLAELKHYCDRKPVTHLYSHLITNLYRCQPENYLDKLVSLFPDKQIVLSGKQADSIQEIFYSNVRILRREEEMYAFAKERDPIFG